MYECTYILYREVSDAWHTYNTPVHLYYQRCFINCDWESQPMWHNVGFGVYGIFLLVNVLLLMHSITKT